MPFENRGGVPRNRQWTVTSTAAKFTPPNRPTKFLQLANLGAVSCRVYWTEADATGDVNYFTLAASGSTGDYFEGPVEIADTEDGIWLKSTGANTTILAISYQRRG
jgi:hypothetical protein